MITKTAKAKRGDLIIIEKVERTFFVTKGWLENRWFYVYEVAGLFRDGRVRSVRSVAWSGPVTQDIEGRHAMLGLVQTYLLPAASVDKDAVVKAVTDHCYPNSDTPMPFDSLDELRALVKPFRRQVVTR